MDLNYEPRYRSIPLIYLTFAAAVLWMPIWVVARIVSEIAHTSESYRIAFYPIRVAGLACIIIATAAAGAAFLREACKTWHLLGRYRLTDAELAVRTPPSKRRRSVRFDEVQQIRHFCVSTPHKVNTIEAFVLVPIAGHAICITNRLPQWDEIVRRCKNAEFQS
jgi:hypothetical protein